MKTISKIFGKARVWLAAIVASVVLFSAHGAAAQLNVGLNQAASIGLATTDIRTLVGRIISAFLGLLGFLAVLLIMYAGYLWLTAGGSDEKVTKAKRVMVNAVIGLFIIVAAYAIAQFVIRAITGGTEGVTNGCPTGQICSGGPGGTFGGGATGGFRVSGVAPAGPGPQSAGWPKNYGITIGLTASVAADTVTDATLIVKKCNPRVDGGGSAQAFDLSACSDTIVGTQTVDGPRILFKPSTTPGAEPTDFEGNFWYYVQLRGGVVKDTRGRQLICPLHVAGPTGDVSSPDASRDLCERAIAMNDQRDVAPPTITISVPHSPPAYCASLIRVQATGRDDFMVSGIDFLLNGGTAGLVDAGGEPLSVSVNGGLANPFVSEDVFIDTSALPPSQPARLTAVAKDGVPQSSTVAEALITPNPASCCNNTKDADEDGVDCGANSQCGACAGGSCTDDSQCQSGFCNTQTHRCEERPVIDAVAPANGGVGSLITVSGRFFGAAAGKITFLGGDTDGDGDPKGDADDVETQACAASAWSPTQVVVAVPAGAKSGPLELATAAGPADRTDTAPGWSGVFTVNTTIRPGICTLEPASGQTGAAFTIKGTAFGGDKGQSQVFMGAQVVDIAQGGWATDGASIRAVVPQTTEAAYDLKVRVGDTATGVETNVVRFTVTAVPGQAAPHIVELLPASGPIGSFVTVQGSGFGSRKGKVRFTYGSGVSQEVALGEDPSCAITWADNYVIIKVPQKYNQTNANRSLASDADGEVHSLQVVTAQGKQSNTVNFSVKSGAARPGICSILPDNGPAGSLVTVVGEGFGPGPANADDFPRFSAEFFKDGGKRCLNNPAASCTVLGEPCAAAADGICVPAAFTATAYGQWSDHSMTATVPGDRDDKATWPKSGPLYLIAGNQLSSNGVPFTVRDCNDNGGNASCPADRPFCCANGSCQDSCTPPARKSAFAWRLSTELLPAVPVVVERPQCDATGGEVQSPSPYKSSRDACKNAFVMVEFNKVMSGAALLSDPDSTRFEKCGIGDSPDCTQSIAVPATKTSALTANPDGSPRGSLLAFASQNPLERNAWYRVTLVSDVRNSAQKKGLFDLNDKYLDGDFDGNEGGDYQWTFRVRDSDEPCALSNVIVSPSKFVINHDGPPASTEPPPGSPPGTPSGFLANLLAQNCNPLRCSGGEYVIGWSTADNANDQYVSLTPPETEACLTRMSVLASKETPPATPVTLTAAAAPVRSPGPPKEGSSSVAVKFADPVVTEYEPNCTEACINAQISASFNVPMDPDSLSPVNVTLQRCRNASCTAPFEPILGTNRGAAPVTINGQTRKVTINGGGLAPSTFYRVRLKSGPDGVKSSSGVPLTGLNDGDSFTWIFRTKDDATPCRVDRASIAPTSQVLYFVTQRANFVVTPFGAPDACNVRGQALTGTDYDWLWDQSEQDEIGQGVIGSYLNAVAADKKGNLDTAASPPLGCNNLCINVGSQNVIPQCGNGAIERGEDCDGTAGCSRESCVFTGTAAPTCGNGTIDPGEACEKIGEVFPVGCKDPAVHVAGWQDGFGCVTLGATVGNSQCGDGFIGDGESCDDGNRTNGDGCSAECIHEGTLRSCLDADASHGESCINFCGNGRQEPGEDADCDRVAGHVSPGCDVRTCLKVGTVAPLCGNGLPDPGEECDAVNGVFPSFCTSKCLLKGSSHLYSAPSFCGDSILGAGEDISCDGSASGPDGNFDPQQVISAGIVPPGSQTTQQVTATVPDIASAEKSGSSDVMLSCTCRQQTQPQQYCSAIAQSINQSQNTDIALGCDKGGCCAPAPRLLQPTFPANGSHNACRNTAIRLTFDQAMDQQSASQHVLVGELTTAAACGGVCSNDASVTCIPGDQAQNLQACGAGNSCVVRASLPVIALDTKGRGSRLAAGVRSVAGAIGGLIRSVVLPNATASDIPPPTALFCVVPGRVAVNNSVITFSTAHAFKAGTWYRVAVEGGENGLTAANSVPFAATENVYFETGPEICKMDRINLTPQSQIFTTSQDLGNGTPGDQVDGDQAFVAQAHAAGRSADSDIVSTPEYGFKWNWVLPTDSPEKLPNLPIIRDSNSVAPEVNGFCELGEGANSPDCRVPRQGTPVCGDDICQAGESACAQDCSVKPGEAALTLVRVKTAKDAAGFPKNGDTVVRVEADVSENGGLLKSHFTASSDVTVMLCENPWPSRKTCTNGEFTVPWDPTNPRRCATGQTIGWAPFEDPDTHVRFSYCRDGQQQGDGAAALPAFKEQVVRIQPGRDILKEYLFTFDSGSVAATSKPWLSDAVGLRTVKNLDHLSIVDWYVSKGFRGAPTLSKIDGYNTIREGRTVYVNAGTKFVSSNPAATDASGLYTNVHVLSYNDGASPETLAVFGQILQNIDLSANVRDDGYCTDGEGRQYCVAVKDAAEVKKGDIVPCAGDAEPVSCVSDTQCQVDAAGVFLKARLGFHCAAYKSKLVRDVQRWSDYTSMRTTILSKRGAGYPTLEAGSFLRAESTSRWPSWDAVLGSAFGGKLPQDPLNDFRQCGPVCSNDRSLSCTTDTECGGGTCLKFDPDTCFNASQKLYLCPSDSNVYEYQSIGAADFRLRGDLELDGGQCAGLDQTTCGSQQDFCEFVNGACQRSRTSVWRGTTCVERLDQTACGQRLDCEWTGTSCQYKEGRLFVGGVNEAAICRDQVIGEGGICGDGVVQGSEQCEVGETRATQCTVNNRIGSLKEVCNTSCRFVTAPGEQCRAGVCGDGVVQSPTEICDDGTLNGTYGHCNIGCSGQGFRCGDRQTQPGERCDCGDALNGAYAFNGVTQSRFAAVCGGLNTTAPINTCQWDCSGAGPRCGDGAVQESEQCDGGFQEFKGFCSDAAQTGCNTNADCPQGSTCGNFCPRPEQKNRRTCNANNASSINDDPSGSASSQPTKACHWNAWNCTAPGSCGNGTMESGEECDDGNTNNSDGCIIDPAAGIFCKKSVCGDSYVAATNDEQCDEGVNNNVACVPNYDSNCNYCSNQCKVSSVSGGFCGDGVLQNAQSNPPGPEQCDGNFGLGNQYICIGSNPADLSFGRKVGAATCGTSCQRSCPAGSQVCENRLRSYSGDYRTSCLADSSHGNIDFDCDGISNACDPDDDNDGVPAVSGDCNDRDVLVHGRYAYETANQSIEFAAAEEICNDDTDNNCDGLSDNWVKSGRNAILGDVRDALFVNVPIKEATVKIASQTNSSVQDTITLKTDSQGRYRANVGAGVDRNGNPACQLRISVTPPDEPPDVDVLPGSNILEDRSNGYWNAIRTVPGSFEEPTNRSLPRVFLMPKVGDGQAIAALVWDGYPAYIHPDFPALAHDGNNLYKFLDAHLYVPPVQPDNLSYHVFYIGNSTATPPTGRGNAAIDSEYPHAFLSCYHDSELEPTAEQGDCGAFGYAPETMAFNWNASGSGKYKFFINDYSCENVPHEGEGDCRRNEFFDQRAKILLSLPDSLRTYSADASAAFANKKGKYWYAFDLQKIADKEYKVTDGGSDGGLTDITRAPNTDVNDVVGTGFGIINTRPTP